MDNIEEHKAQCTCTRARLPWDLNSEDPGKILLKCEKNLGQQKYMGTIIKKNENGQITDKIEGQEKVEHETKQIW